MINRRKPSHSVIVKSSDAREKPFARKTLYSSLMRESLSINIPLGQAEEIARLTCDHVEKWIHGRRIVTTTDIHRIATSKLNRLHTDLAYIYANNTHII